MITKTKKLVKQALKHPELYSWAELAFFRRWLEQRKARKEAKKTEALLKNKFG